MGKKYNWSREWLYNEHIVKGKSINKIADEQGVSWATIRDHLIKNDIPIQKHGNSDKQYPNLEPSPNLSYILGVIDGDGSVNGVDRIELGTKDYEFAKEFETALKAIGLRANTRNNDRWNKSLKRQQRIQKCYASSAVFVDWYRSLLREQKEEIVQQFPEEYLKGMFESEGTYTIVTNGGVHVHFSNTDYESLLMVQRLLALLGYDSNIYEFKFKDYFSGQEKIQYRLNLLGSSEEKHEFIKRIKPVIKNQPYNYSDPNGLRGRKPKVRKGSQKNEIPNCRQI